MKDSLIDNAVYRSLEDNPIDNRDDLLIYISGPYSLGNVILNARRAIQIGQEIARRGYNVFVPHTNLLWDFVDPESHEFYMRQDISVVKRCDAIFRLIGESVGGDAEVALAQSLGIPAFFEEEGDLDACF
jgi:hypothetical protein